jgi:hypothetical protein
MLIGLAWRARGQEATSTASKGHHDDNTEASHRGRR